MGGLCPFGQKIPECVAGAKWTPNDPVFFLHHTYLDLLWERWKQQHPTDEPYVPTSGTPGRDLTSTLVYHAAGQPAPWQGSWTIAQVMKPNDLDYSYA